MDSQKEKKLKAAITLLMLIKKGLEAGHIKSKPLLADDENAETLEMWSLEQLVDNFFAIEEEHVRS